jgi:hypothetical protein
MKNTNLKILLCVIPGILIILNLIDFNIVLFGKGGYPFGSEFFPNGSIYASKNIYVTYNLLFTLLLIVTVLLIWKEKWKWLIMISILDILLFLYPLFIN